MRIAGQNGLVLPVLSMPGPGLIEPPLACADAVSRLPAVTTNALLESFQPHPSGMPLVGWIDTTGNFPTLYRGLLSNSNVGRFLSTAEWMLKDADYLIEQDVMQLPARLPYRQGGDGSFALEAFNRTPSSISIFDQSVPQEIAMFYGAPDTPPSITISKFGADVLLIQSAEVYSQPGERDGHYVKTGGFNFHINGYERATDLIFGESYDNSAELALAIYSLIAGSSQYSEDAMNREIHATGESGESLSVDELLRKVPKSFMLSSMYIGSKNVRRGHRHISVIMNDYDVEGERIERVTIELLPYAGAQVFVMPLSPALIDHIWTPIMDMIDREGQEYIEVLAAAGAAQPSGLA